MAALPKYPRRIFFYCDTPPSEGGETPIVLSDIVYEKVKEELPEFVEELSAKGVRNNRRMPDGVDDLDSEVGRSWQAALMTTSVEEAEQICKRLYEKYEWLEDGSLQTSSKKMDAFRLDPRTNRMTWFNNIVATHYAFQDARNVPEKAITYGDDSTIKRENIERVYAIMKEHSVAFKWRKGDVILVDNELVLHSRNEYKPPRRILVGLCE